MLVPLVVLGQVRLLCRSSRYTQQAERLTMLTRLCCAPLWATSSRAIRRSGNLSGAAGHLQKRYHLLGIGHIRWTPRSCVESERCCMHGHRTWNDHPKLQCGDTCMPCSQSTVEYSCRRGGSRSWEALQEAIPVQQRQLPALRRSEGTYIVPCSGTSGIQSCFLEPQLCGCSQQTHLSHLPCRRRCRAYLIGLSSCHLPYLASF